MDQQLPHILIVDDDEPNRRLVKRMLRSQYRMDEACNVFEAIAVLENHSSSIQLILSDYLMPGKSGAELALEVRKRWPSIFFVLLTGFESDEVTHLAENGTICDLLIKPWRIADLRKVLEDRLATAAK